MGKIERTVMMCRYSIFIYQTQIQSQDPLLSYLNMYVCMYVYSLKLHHKYHIVIAQLNFCIVCKPCTGPDISGWLMILFLVSSSSPYSWVACFCNLILLENTSAYLISAADISWLVWYFFNTSHSNTCCNVSGLSQDRGQMLSGNIPLKSFLKEVDKMQLITLSM